MSEQRPSLIHPLTTTFGGTAAAAPFEIQSYRNDSTSYLKTQGAAHVCAYPRRPISRPRWGCPVMPASLWCVPQCSCAYVTARHVHDAVRDAGQGSEHHWAFPSRAAARAARVMRPARIGIGMEWKGMNTDIVQSMAGPRAPRPVVDDGRIRGLRRQTARGWSSAETTWIPSRATTA